MHTDTTSSDAAGSAADEYQFMTSIKDGVHCVVLVDRAMLASPTPFTPWFVWAFSSEAECDAVQRWIGRRIGRWQAWGRMARFSYDLFERHLRAALAAEPVEPLPLGYSVSGDPEGARSVTLFELVETAAGPVRKMAWQGTYASAGECRQVLSWLRTEDMMLHGWQSLADMAFIEGVEAVTRFVAEHALTQG